MGSVIGGPSAGDGNCSGCVAADLFDVRVDGGADDVAGVDDDAAAHAREQCRPIQVAVLLPFGGDDDCVGAAQSISHVLSGTVVEVGPFAFGTRHGDGIVRGDGRAQLIETGNQVVGGRVAQIVRIWLEGHTQDRDALALQAAHLADELVDDDLPLAGVDVDGGLQDGHGVVVLASSADQSGRVLTKAAAAPAGPGVEEAAADAGVHADARGDFFDVRAYPLAQARDFVGEADLEGQEGVRGVLDHLRALQGGVHHGGAGVRLGPRGAGGRCERLLDERGVQAGHDLQGVGVAAQDDAVGVEAVLQGGAFPQEFGVADHAVPFVAVAGRVVLEEALHVVAGADGHGGFVDDDLRVPVEVRREFLGGAGDVLQIRRAVLAGGSAHADEHDVRPGDGVVAGAPVEVAFDALEQRV